MYQNLTGGESVRGTVWRVSTKPVNITLRRKYVPTLRHFITLFVHQMIRHHYTHPKKTKKRREHSPRSFAAARAYYRLQWRQKRENSCACSRAFSSYTWRNLRHTNRRRVTEYTPSPRASMAEVGMFAARLHVHL